MGTTTNVWAICVALASALTAACTAGTGPGGMCGAGTSDCMSGCAGAKSMGCAPPSVDCTNQCVHDLATPAEAAGCCAEFATLAHCQSAAPCDTSRCTTQDTAYRACISASHHDAGAGVDAAGVDAGSGDAGTLRDAGITCAISECATGYHGGLPGGVCCPVDYPCAGESAGAVVCGARGTTALTNESCCSTTPSCSTLGTACVTGSDCCSGWCEGNVCQCNLPPLSSCSEPHQCCGYEPGWICDSSRGCCAAAGTSCPSGGSVVCCGACVNYVCE